MKGCKKVILKDHTFYHGSPSTGLAEIKRAKMIYPQAHGILPGDWFCISSNDNMLRCFSDGEDTNGMIFEPPVLQCLQLDDMHMALACWESSCELQADWLKEKPEEEAVAYRLEYSMGRGDLGMSEDDFREILPKWVDGLIFPGAVICPWGGLYPSSWNDEAEIALNQQGCEKIWPKITQLAVRGEWEEDTRKGWARILRNSRNQNAEFAN